MILCLLVNKERKTVATYFYRNDMDLYDLEHWKEYLQKFMCDET